MCNYACLACIPKSNEKRFVLRPKGVFITGTAYSFNAEYDASILGEYLTLRSFEILVS